MRAAVIAVLAAAAGSASLAQTDPDACAASADLRDFYSQWKNSGRAVAMLRERLAQEPENVFLNRWYLESPRLRPGALAEEYRKKLSQHPEDARYLYYYGHALMGSDTTKALEYFQQAIAKDPAFPSAWWSLMEVYSSPNFKDSTKLADAMLTYNNLCADVSGFGYLRSVDDKAAVRDLAARYRKAVEARSTIGVAPLYSNLWTAEFRVADPKEFDRLRQQVAEDMKRVRQLDPENTATLIQGYKLTGDSDAAKALEEKAAAKRKPQRFYDVFQAWSKEHPYPKPASPQDETDFLEARLAAAKQWVKDWPEETNAQYWLLISLDYVKKTPNEEVIAAGEELLDREAREAPAWASQPSALTVAQVWSSRDIRLQDCARLLDEAVATIDRGPVDNNDMRRVDSVASSLTAQFADARLEVMVAKVEVYRKLREFENARALLRDIRTRLDHAEEGNWRRFEFGYLMQLARLAEAEEHKLDALGYYIMMRRHGELIPRETKEHVAALWRELGGSADVFNLWTSAIGPEKVPARPTVATAVTAWTAMDRPLAALKAEDLTGKTWTVTDLKGKTTLINVWATWCEPCRKELPQLQKLYEQTRDRKDIQVISIAVDENPGLIGPFLAQNHYSFPVVLAKSLVDQLMPSLSIPRNWISDANGILRFEAIGFDSRATDWPAQMLDKMMK